MPKKPSSYSLVLSTCPNEKAGKRIATKLVEERLAACVNLLPIRQSIYRWKGKIESAKEILLIIKIRRRDYTRVQARIKALHPYQLPEIVAVAIADGYAPYLAWLNNPDR